MEKREAVAYLSGMDDDLKPPPPPHPWLADMEQGRADVAAGRTFSFEEVIGEFEREDDAERAAIAAVRTQSRRRIAKA
jgi:hypothetical protein